MILTTLLLRYMAANGVLPPSISNDLHGHGPEGAIAKSRRVIITPLIRSRLTSPGYYDWAA